MALRKKIGRKRSRKTTVHPAMHHLLGKTLHKGGRKRAPRKRV